MDAGRSFGDLYRITRQRVAGGLEEASRRKQPAGARVAGPTLADSRGLVLERWRVADLSRRRDIRRPRHLWHPSRTRLGADSAAHRTLPGGRAGAVAGPEVAGVYI